jgi:hypothetical protein
MRTHRTDRVRYADSRRVPDVVRQASCESGVCVVAQPVLAEGRVELLWYLREQSVSIEYHRYGNLGSRSGNSQPDTGYRIPESELIRANPWPLPPPVQLWNVIPQLTPGRGGGGGAK